MTGGKRGHAHPAIVYTTAGGGMTFEALLDQATALLQRRGRVSYRTLQRQFNLDDTALEDLKEAILFAHPQVVDEEGRGLVWLEAPASATASPIIRRRKQ